MQNLLHKIKLHNWRKFEQFTAMIPQQSGVIVDTNGSGKTSILSGVYSLLTGKPWPGTRFNQTIRFGQQYFGVGAGDDWLLSGQVSPSGRLLVKYFKPEETQNWPRVVTYLPTDNNWLASSRINKLGVLDEMIASLIGSHYAKAVAGLDTAVKSKQRLIKYTLDSGSSGDLAMVQTLGQEIYKYSQYLWGIRQKFFIFWQKNIETFTDWIDTPLKDWEIHWHLSNIFGQKDIFKNSELEFGATADLSNQDWSKLWQKELASSKVLFGAHRDDFSLISNHLAAESIFSRGEMRLLVLFVKDLAVTWSKDFIEEISPVFYLYDDVFNELDTLREETLFAKVLQKHDWFLASSTKPANFDCENFAISKLTNI